MTSSLREQLQATLKGGYTIERELGGGGMSQVFVAEEHRLGRKVVIKVLSPELAQGLSVDRFEREIRTVAALQHANIVPVHTAGDTQGIPFYTMPFVEGDSLRKRIAEGALPVAEVVGILRDVARALAYAHQRGVVHRDIKPDNTLLSGGVAVVTDFGIAKAISASRTAVAGAALTQVGTSIGTPAYMAPEQAAGDPDVDHRADLYSLGAMAYELLCAQQVFVGRTPQRTLAAHMSEVPRPIAELRPDVPPALAALTMRCLAKDPDERPQNADEVLRALDAVTSGAERIVVPEASPAHFTRALILYAVACLVVGALAKGAITTIGLPDWVLPGALGVMLLGLPVILWTGFVKRVVQAEAAAPTVTPGGSVTNRTQGPMASLALRAAPRTSWRRTARGGVFAMGAFALAVAGFLVMRAFNIGPAATLVGRGTIGASDAVVMTDFTVISGDTSLARVVSFAVRTVLSQSTLLRVVDQQRMARTLELMERPSNTRVDFALAREVAERDGAKAIVDGEVATVGAGYVLTLRLISADSGRVLVALQEAGEGPRGLIDAADRVARALRAKAGESLREVQNAAPLRRTRTASLEALRLFSEGVYYHQVNVDFERSERLYRQAIAADTLFAEAWRRLGLVMNNLERPRPAVDSVLARAFALRDRVDPRGKGSIEGAYYSHGPGRDRVKTIAAYEQAGGFGNNLALALTSRREYARAESILRAVASDTTFLLGQFNLVLALLNQGKTDEASTEVGVLRRRFTSTNWDAWDAMMSYQRQDLDSTAFWMRRWRAGASGFDVVRSERAIADLALLRGGVGEWAAVARATPAKDSAFGRRTDPLTWQARLARTVHQVTGDADAEWAAFDASMARRPLRTLPDASRPDLEIATDLAWAGRTAKARAVLAEYDATVRDTAVKRDQEPNRRTALAAIALAEGRHADAIAGFRRGDSLPDGPANDCNVCLPLYLGRAFDAASQPDSAIAQFELYLRTPQTPNTRFSVDALALPAVRERLGQLYAAKGDAAKAVEHYRAFVELWKNADPVLQPRVAAARRRIDELTAPERRR